MQWSKVHYMPQAKWKFGERTAIGQLEGWKSEAICPIFRLNPPGDYDPGVGAKITPEVFLKTFGAQLQEARGRLPSIIDGASIENLRNDETGSLFFGDLLERARLAGANPVPVFSPNSSAQYLAAVGKYASGSSGQGACLRIDVADLEFFEDRESLLKECDRVGISPSDCVLLIDAGPLTVTNFEEFTTIVANQFARLICDGDWQVVVWSAGAFPERDFLKAGESGSFERNEWKLFREMFERKEEFSVFPIFSDYLLEYPRPAVIRGISPTAKILYSTENRFFIFKGRSVKVDAKYRNIFGVAKRVVDSGIFKGESFSPADYRIVELSREQGGTGHAGTWRWIATAHHLEVVAGQLNAMFDLGVADQRAAVEPDQLRLV